MARASNFDILVDRLEAGGVNFAERPTRLHSQMHGTLRDTFFVWTNPRARHPLDTQVGWSIDHNGWIRRGIEAYIARPDKLTLHRFVRGPLYLYLDDNSGYGIGLLVSSAPPDEWNERDCVRFLPTPTKDSSHG